MTETLQKLYEFINTMFLAVTVVETIQTSSVISSIRNSISIF